MGVGLKVSWHFFGFLEFSCDSLKFLTSLKLEQTLQAPLKSSQI